MKKICFSLIILAARILCAQETESTTMARNQIRAFIEETEKLYSSEDTEKNTEAATRFRALLDQSPEGELNPSALKLAEGMAKLKAGKPGEALEVLDEIEGFESPEMRGQLRQMKGNAQLKIAEAAVTGEDWENAKSGMGKAIESFTNALRENPEMDAARNNLEFAQKRLLEIKEMEPPPPEDQNKDQEDKQEQEKNQDEQKQPPEDQNQQDQNQNQDQNQDQDQQNEDQNRDQEQQQDQGQQDPQDQEQKQDQQKPSDQGDESEEKNPSEQGQADQEQQPDQEQGADQSGAAGEMTDAEKLDALQAQQILDAALEQEKAQRRLIQQQRIRVIPVEKDW